MMNYYVSLLLLVGCTGRFASGFIVQHHPTPPTSVIDAKKTGKKRKASTSSAGSGFGTTKMVEERVDDDYKVFPRLEAKVEETLVASPDTTAAGDLPNEIYQRLDQIYGFPDFNYETAAAEPVSLTDMLSTSSEPVNDLLNPSSSTASPGPLSSNDLHLEQIPPFSKFHVLHIDPLVLLIEDFFTPEECDRYIAKSNSNKVQKSRSPTVGKDAVAKAQRTSTTWYHHYKGVPELMAKASRLLGLEGIDHWEEPQTVRYRRNEKFTWHLDALGPDENQPNLGGQRTATLLVYHSDLTEEEGGATLFRDLKGNDSTGPLAVQPRKGSALLFFPAAGGIPDAPFDIRTLHSGQAVSSTSSQDKWISQLWLRQGTYTPTAPPGNEHEAATTAISEYCSEFL